MMQAYLCRSICKSPLRRWTQHKREGELAAFFLVQAQQQYRWLSGNNSPAGRVVWKLQDDDDDDDNENADGLADEFDFLPLSLENDPWKYLVSRPSRASWRATQAHRSSPLDQSISTIINTSIHPTRPRFVFKTFEALVKKMRKLAKRRQRQRKRFYENKSFASEEESRQDKEANTIVHGPPEALAGYRHRVRPIFQITKRVLEEAYSLTGRKQGKFQPRRILDFGIGCGSASAAALEVFRDDCRIEWIHGVDASKVMREASENFLQSFCENSNVAKYQKNTEKENNKFDKLAPRITTSAHLSSDPTMSPEKLNKTMARSAFDLCLFCYTATEMKKCESILTAAALLWEKLKPNGLFVMIEPGTADGFHSIRAVREMLLTCCPPNSTSNEVGGVDECHILAPCTHNGPCPLGMFEGMNEMSDTEEEDDDDDEKADNVKDTTTKKGRRALKEEVVTDDEFQKMLQQTEMTDEEYKAFLKDMEERSAQESDDEDDDTEERSAQENDDEDDDTVEEKDEEELDETPGDVYGEIDYNEDMEGEEADEDHGDITIGKGFCSFLQTFPNSKGHKFSYLVAQKRTPGTDEAGLSSEVDGGLDHINLTDLILKQMALDIDDPQLEEGNQQAVQLAALSMKSLDKLGLDFVAAHLSSHGRIIRAPLKRGRHVLLDCCTRDGLVRHTVAKRLDKNVPGLYEGARKARWGGFWPNGASIKEDKVGQGNFQTFARKRN